MAMNGGGSNNEPLKPVVIGIYGVSGCGKTTLVNQLKERLGRDEFVFYDGSTAIDIAFPGDIETFKLLDVDAKAYWRRMAIHNVKTICQQEHKVGIVAGHYMFWEQDLDPDIVWTDGDKSSYTHMLYLERPVEEIARQCAQDKGRNRRACTIEHLAKWQRKEKDELRHACLKAGTLYSVLPALTSDKLVDHVARIVCDFQQHDKESNLRHVQARFDDAFGSRCDKLKTMLLVDGDKTLVNEDSGRLFWELCSLDPFQDGRDPLRAVFCSRDDYAHWMFRQVMLMYEETGDDSIFDAICGNVANMLTVRPEFRQLLQSAMHQEHVGILVLTVGLGRIFSKLLEREGLSDSVTVIGSGRFDDGFVVTGEVKGSLVSHIRRKLGARIFAFGDSRLDISMLTAADEAIVVVDDVDNRSKSMEIELRERIARGWSPNSNLWQLLSPGNVPPLLQVHCPQFDLTPASLSAILAQPIVRPITPKVLHATEKAAAQLLMTPMRNAACQGPVLRRAHHDAGKYLAVEYISQAIGIEPYEVPHVQGRPTEGYRVRGEKRTLVVALMRGGEPMASGVSEILASAMFLHAKDPGEVDEDNIRGKHTVILVDSVINSGKSVLQFLVRIRHFHGKVHIVIVAGVVQKDAILAGALASFVADDPNISLIALRLSENKYTGKGGTDTGNRLFNTTHL